jgi:hypothetical protein
MTALVRRTRRQAPAGRRTRGGPGTSVEEVMSYVPRLKSAIGSAPLPNPTQDRPAWREFSRTAQRGATRPHGMALMRNRPRYLRSSAPCSRGLQAFVRRSGPCAGILDCGEPDPTCLFEPPRSRSVRSEDDSWRVASMPAEHDARTFPLPAVPSSGFTFSRQPAVSTPVRRSRERVRAATSGSSGSVPRHARSSTRRCARVRSNPSRVVHDDVEPFEQIARRRGQDLLSGPLAACNTWPAN